MLKTSNQRGKIIFKPKFKALEENNQADAKFFINRGETGNKEFPSKRYLPRGGSSKEGIRVVVLNSTYYWRPVQGTKFSLGLVIADGDHRETLSRQMPPKGTCG